jgi:hypothetical protein
MGEEKKDGRPIFLMADNGEYAEHLVCGGLVHWNQGSGPCSHAVEGCFPGLQSDGNGGFVCPCLKFSLGTLARWQGHGGNLWREELLPLLLFKCKMGYWFVVEGVEAK